MTTPLYIDTDNALGSARGDIDDGFAITALLQSGLPIASLSSVSGNTDAASADRNNQALGQQLEFSGPYHCGANAKERNVSAASNFLCSYQGALRVVALGPLTNIATALDQQFEVGQKIQELLLVGANSSTKGRWPPLYPFEFNITKDLPAAQRVFGAGIALRIIPLDQACRLRVGLKDLQLLESNIGQYLRRHSRRWILRSHFLKASRTVPLWDLVAAMSIISPALFQFEKMAVKIHNNGWIEFDRSPPQEATRREATQTAQVLRDFDVTGAWQAFSKALGTGT